jgi:hypothetical protein
MSCSSHVSVYAPSQTCNQFLTSFFGYHYSTKEPLPLEVHSCGIQPIERF